MKLKYMEFWAEDFPTVAGKTSDATLPSKKQILIREKEPASMKKILALLLVTSVAVFIDCGGSSRAGEL